MKGSWGLSQCEKEVDDGGGKWFDFRAFRV